MGGRVRESKEFGPIDGVLRIGDKDKDSKGGRVKNGGKVPGNIIVGDALTGDGSRIEKGGGMKRGEGSLFTSYSGVWLREDSDVK